MVGKRFHFGILIVAVAKAHAGKENVGSLLFFYQLDKARFRRNANIKVAVGRKDNAVVAALDKIFACYLVSLVYTALAVCGAVCDKGVDSLCNSGVVAAFKPLADNPVLARVGDDGYGVLVGQLLL